MTTVAAIDCGTNSIRLLVADVDVEAGTLRDLDRRMEVVRLGQGVDRTGRIAPEALARTLDAAQRYGAVCAELGVERIRFVATSASRDAENRADFVDGVRAALGTEPEVIGGEEEAAEEVDAASNGHGELDGAELFNGLIEVEIGPLSDFSQLVGFEDAAKSIGATADIAVTRFSEGRATLELSLAEPVALLRELEERCDL